MRRACCGWVLILAASPALTQETRPMNRLARETSPYLQQHKSNPVDWYPWGEEAIARAKRENKPIFLSIGYSACHWCHVMEHESFSNPDIAKFMNEKFVNVKVDREERPDLDEIYMAAVQRMAGQGGWPMSVFLTPELKPFFGGTYWPPDERYGRPGFKRVLEHIAKIWETRRDDALRAAADVAAEVQSALKPDLQPGEPRLEHVAAAVKTSAERFDPEAGGFGSAPQFAPKFPHASELSLLLRHWARTRDARSREMVERSLQKMDEGGIHDQIGGGFHRYSTDREWLVPHFEKMLYDNALLARTYAEAFTAFGDARYARVVRSTLDYLLREMTDPAGGFWSATDADSEGEEGRFFVWKQAEWQQVLGEDAELAALRWDVTAGGNWEHANVLRQKLTVAEVATRTKLEVAEVERRLERARAKLYAHRAKRAPPFTDDKVLAAWNGLAIAAFASAHQALGEERYLAAAQRAADFVLTRMYEGGKLRRLYRQGEARGNGYLEDHAFVAEALLVLFESDFDPRWLRGALGLLATIRDEFRDEDGGLFFTGKSHEELVARSKSATESSTPSGVAIAALAFLRAGLITGDEELYALGAGAMRANHPLIERFGIAVPSLLLAVELHLGEPKELVIAGDPKDEATRAMLAKARATFPPHHVTILAHDGNRAELEKLAPPVQGKKAVGGKSAAYVCKRGVCGMPVTEPSGLKLR